MPESSLRAFNRSQVQAAVVAGATSRAEIASVTGLARSTVTSVVIELLAEGILQETDENRPADRKVGRPSRRLVNGRSDDLAVAVDFGHSHCRIGILDSDGQAVLPIDEATFDVDSSPEFAIDHARVVIEGLLAGLGPRRSAVIGAAIGLPAPVNIAAGTVGPGNVLPKWRDRSPAKELATALGMVVDIENDANLGALAEMSHGAAAGCQDIVYVKVSTGVGAGLVLGGRLHRGTSGMAGEIGHVPVDNQGALCRCGNRGCLESVASIGNVLALLQAVHPQVMTTAGLVDLVARDDLGATRVVADAGRQLGRALADLVNTLNPEMIVIGGELAMVPQPLLTGINDSLHRFAQQDIVDSLRVRVGELGEQAQLIGAAVLARSRHHQPARSF